MQSFGTIGIVFFEKKWNIPTHEAKYYIDAGKGILKAFRGQKLQTLRGLRPLNHHQGAYSAPWTQAVKYLLDRYAPLLVKLNL